MKSTSKKPDRVPVDLPQTILREHCSCGKRREMSRQTADAEEGMKSQSDQHTTAANYVDRLDEMGQTPRVDLTTFEPREVFGESISLRETARRFTTVIATVAPTDSNGHAGAHAVADAVASAAERRFAPRFADVETPAGVPPFEVTFSGDDVYGELFLHDCLSDGLDVTDTEAVDRVVAVALEIVFTAIDEWADEVDAKRTRAARSAVFQAVAEAGHRGDLDRAAVHELVDETFDELAAREADQ